MPIRDVRLVRLLLALAGLAALCMSLAAGEARAQVRTSVIGDPSFQQMADGFLVPGPPGRVRVVLSACPPDPTAQGCHVSGRVMDTIWLNPDASGLDAETFAHEMGHVFESYMWNAYWQHRARTIPRLFRRIVPLLGLQAKPGVLASTVWTERFAEAYSLCARVSSLDGPISTGYWEFETSPERHAATCSLIGALGSAYEHVRARSRARG